MMCLQRLLLRFIKAEVVNYKDLLEMGSLAAAREKGLVGMEGKDYVVKDGDVIKWIYVCQMGDM